MFGIICKRLIVSITHESQVIEDTYYPSLGVVALWTSITGSRALINDFLKKNKYINVLPQHRKIIK